jgi:Leu/Phe-tRNA-protein transferase
MRRRGRRPVLLLPGGPIAFPDPELADDEGLLAIGGDLSIERLLFAYEHGIFPWYDEGVPPLWWSPNPRAIIEPVNLHVSRSMRRVLKSDRFQVTYDEDFEHVMRCCGDRAGGTWKVALVYAVRSLFAAGVTLFDVQLLTSHLASMGATEIGRSDYLSRLPVACRRQVDLRCLELRY